MNIFLLVFDRRPGYEYNSLLQSIKGDQDIKDWWHYIQSGYILVSPLDVNQLSDKIMSYFPNHRFLLIAIKPAISQGWLPKDAWDWIKKYPT